MDIFKLNNKILLLIFIIIFTFLGAGKAFNHQITHSSPTGLMASDAFTHNWVSQKIFDTGYLNRPPEYGFDNKEEYLENINNWKLFHPPVLPILTVSIAKLSNLNVFDVNIILVFLLISIIILLNYFILAKFNTTLALFSLPFSLLFLQRKFFISLSWGWWDFITGEFFLFAIILLMLNEKFNYRYILNGILILLAFMAHGMEAGYATIFIFFYLIFNFVFNKKDVRDLIIEQVKSLAVILVIGVYAINTLLKTMGSIGSHQFKMMSNAEFIADFYRGVPANYFIYFTEFINFRLLIVIGCLILLYILITKKSKLLTYYFFVIFMSLSPHLYITAGERGFQWRFLWPIYLSFAVGSVCFLVYLLLNKIIKEKFLSKSIIFTIYSIILIIMVTPLPFAGAGLVDESDYQSYKWVHDNTDIYSKFLILFSPINNQISRVFLLKRNLFVSDVESWQSMNINNSILINLKDHQPTAFFCEKIDCSLFKKSYFAEKRWKGKKEYVKNRSICYFDYIYIPLKNQEEIHNKNIYYLNHLIDKNISQVVFNNMGAIIAKNIIKGEACENRLRS